MNATGQRLRAAAAFSLALALAACASQPRNPQPAAAAPAPPPLDASYDWHGLLLVPFGSVLKDIPFKLHEVLLFRDSAPAAQPDDAECYAVERSAPRFVARIPSEYLLCFKHDHLARVQATVNLPPGEAARIFSDACGLWQRNAQAGVPGAGLPAADQPAAAHADAAAGACEGRDGAIAYSGRLDQEADQADAPLTINLDSAVQL